MSATPHAATAVETRRALGTAAGAALAVVRPRQWTKNALVFAALLFAAKVGDAAAWLDAATTFAAYCALSGAAYVVNDVRDREADRLHPSSDSGRSRAER